MGASSLQRAATKGGLVLLYHSVFESLPKPLDGTIHNTTPETLRRQLEAVGREFTFVSVDELAVMKNPTGFAAVSFDDGYRCVLEEGLAVFESLQIPFTLYLNGGTFNGRPNWRDKVRTLESASLVEEFEGCMQGIHKIQRERDL